MSQKHSQVKRKRLVTRSDDGYVGLRVAKLAFVLHLVLESKLRIGRRHEDVLSIRAAARIDNQTSGEQFMESRRRQ